ncbi:unnamed protein product [Meloidogyne enterolobii]|uniref:Uncharacterized protein n=1 Tax=Meloidogyne enterolobii TaxID=390850 RepID=A0ACB1ARA2_MELEN
MFVRKFFVRKIFLFFYFLIFKTFKKIFSSLSFPRFVFLLFFCRKKFIFYQVESNLASFSSVNQTFSHYTKTFFLGKLARGGQFLCLFKQTNNRLILLGPFLYF